MAHAVRVFFSVLKNTPPSILRERALCCAVCGKNNLPAFTTAHTRARAPLHKQPSAKSAAWSGCLDHRDRGAHSLEDRLVLWRRRAQQAARERELDAAVVELHRVGALARRRRHRRRLDDLFCFVCCWGGWFGGGLGSRVTLAELAATRKKSALPLPPPRTHTKTHSPPQHSTQHTAHHTAHITAHSTQRSRAPGCRGSARGGGSPSPGTSARSRR